VQIVRRAVLRNADHLPQLAIDSHPLAQRIAAWEGLARERLLDHQDEFAARAVGGLDTASGDYARAHH